MSFPITRTQVRRGPTAHRLLACAVLVISLGLGGGGRKKVAPERA